MQFNIDVEDGTESSILDLSNAPSHYSNPLEVSPTGGSSSRRFNRKRASSHSAVPSHPPTLHQARSFPPSLSKKNVYGNENDSSPDEIISPHSASRFSDSDFLHDYDDDEDDELEDESSTGEAEQEEKFTIAWNRVALAVVNHAPCFLCLRNVYTYRSVLTRLNWLCGFFSFFQFLSSLSYYILLQNPSLVDRNIDRDENVDFQSNIEVLTNVWNLNGSIWFLGVLSLLVLISLALTIRVIQNVNLAGAIRFLWLVLWVIPLQVFFSTYLVGVGVFCVSHKSHQLLVYSTTFSSPKSGSSFGGAIAPWPGFGRSFVVKERPTPNVPYPSP